MLDLHEQVICSFLWQTSKYIHCSLYHLNNMSKQETKQQRKIHTKELFLDKRPRKNLMRENQCSRSEGFYYSAEVFLNTTTGCLPSNPVTEKITQQKKRVRLLHSTLQVPLIQQLNHEFPGYFCVALASASKALLQLNWDLIFLQKPIPTLPSKKHQPPQQTRTFALKASMVLCVGALWDLREPFLALHHPLCPLCYLLYVSLYLSAKYSPEKILQPKLLLPLSA